MQAQLRSPRTPQPAPAQHNYCAHCPHCAQLKAQDAARNFQRSLLDIDGRSADSARLLQRLNEFLDKLHIQQGRKYTARPVAELRQRGDNWQLIIEHTDRYRKPQRSRFSGKSATGCLAKAQLELIAQHVPVAQPRRAAIVPLSLEDF